jgi:hypothetical protein
MIYDTRWHLTLDKACAFARRLSRNPQADRRYVIESRSDAGSKWFVYWTDRVRPWERLAAVFENGEEVWRRKAA